MNTNPDLVSVILPVYNGSQYLRAAIESILSQTYQHFELIIINDGSQDDSQQIIDSYTDSRIRSFEQPNMKLAKTLNQGIALAKGRWIARQDQDDVSLPERLARQVDFMRSHPDCALLGTAAQIWINHAKTERVHRHPCSNIQLQAGLLFYNLFVHSSVMMDKQVVQDLGGYCIDPTRQPPEDYELWCRIARRHQLANLAEPLVVYREVESSMSRTGINPFLHNQIQMSAENIAWALSEPIESTPVQILAHFMHRVYPKPLMNRLSFSGIRSILKRTMRGLALKMQLDPLHPQIQLEENALLRKVSLNYCDYLTGGLINQTLSGPFRESVKKTLRMWS